MDRELIKKYGLTESINNYRSLMCEFTTLKSGLVDEADANGDGMDDATGAPAAPAAPAPMPAAPADPNAAMGAAPAAPAPMPAAPADPNAAMGAAPAAPAGPGAQGFTPAPDANQAPTPDGGQAPAPADGGEEAPEEIELPDEAVSDEEFEKSTSQATDKIDAMASKFEETLATLQDIKSQLDANSSNIKRLEGELEKRNPTPVEKLNMRSKDGYPFNSSVDDYWDRKTPDNYKTEPESFEIRKSDIDNISDWSNISREMRGMNTGLKGILGY